MERHPRISLRTPNTSSTYHSCATYYRECRCYNSALRCLCSSNRAVCKDLATVQWFWEYNQTGVSLWKPQFFRQKHHTDTTDLFCLHYWSKDFGHHYFIVSFLQLLNHWFNKICWPSIPWQIIQVQTTEFFIQMVIWYLRSTYMMKAVCLRLRYLLVQGQAKMTSSEAYCSLNEGTIDFIYLCMWGLADITIESSVSSSNVTNSGGRLCIWFARNFGQVIVYLSIPTTRSW
jgi:hypothetical protein